MRESKVMTIEEIRQLAEGHDHFLVERPTRIMSRFILAMLKALDEHEIAAHPLHAKSIRERALMFYEAP